jgi:hypothetical protein
VIRFMLKRMLGRLFEIRAVVLAISLLAKLVDHIRCHPYERTTRLGGDIRSTRYAGSP